MAAADPVPPSVASRPPVHGPPASRRPADRPAAWDGSTDPVAWTGVAADDGTVLRFVVDGSAARDPDAVPVVLCNGIACSDAYWYGVAPLLARTRPVVRWDYRGHGRSDDPVDPRAITPARSAADALAVMDAAGVDRAVLVGHSYGVQVVLEVAREAPSRVAALVAVAGAPGRPLARGADHERGDRLLAALRGLVAATPRLARRTWDSVWDSPALGALARLLGTTTAEVPPEVLRAYFVHVRDRDPELLLDMMQAMGAHSAADVVGRLGMPLLVLAGDRDRITPLAVMRGMALDAPDGSLAVRHGGSHTLPAEHPAWVVDEMAATLDRAAGAA